ncbi:MAG: DNA translocase SpoIIIE [Syntrophomonadaceae bacterium]|nr:DNA translocase SpoIIIE [Bacillota bacterium]
MATQDSKGRRFSFISQKKKNEMWGLSLLVVTFFAILSLVSFFMDPPTILTGPVGYSLAEGIYRVFGWAGYFIPALVLVWSTGKFAGAPLQKSLLKSGGLFALLVGFSVLLAFREFSFLKSHPGITGGGVGYFLATGISHLFGATGTYLVIAFLLVIGLGLMMDFSLTSLPKYILRAVKLLGILLMKILRVAISLFRKKEKKRVRIQERIAMQSEEESKVQLPPLSLLDPTPAIESEKEDIAGNAELLERTLKNFGLETRVVEVNEGPIITSYEVQPASGVRVHSIVSLADDISLALKSPSVRIEAPVPGKAAVGIEIVNKKPRLVYLRELLSSNEFHKAASKLTIAIGKDIKGNPIIGDLRDMPHLLIAGTTGSGKSVCLNSLILSILYKATPFEVKFLMIDPKMVELSCYNALPHLISDVITDPKKVATALRWVIDETEERYRQLASVGVKNIERYNQLSEETPFPYVIVVIDELADLMAVARVSVEDAVTRLAQLSRAVGIHLILATQRPSVDVVTGVIKANLPCRISFQVASRVDSRTVLDAIGAERLLGKGDMLFLPAGLARPIRCQCPLVTDQEVERTVSFLKMRWGKSECHREVFREDIYPSPESEESDELFEKAVHFVMETGIASASTLQRRFRIGYNRAARLIDRMEEEKMIGPLDGNKPRKVLGIGKGE